ncbi:MAG: AMP-binding protein, partial [Leptolyngbyaceae cyanobacterium SM1_3_5]|nr:AMP-binding protein [Leptolyngbyaceae cyanobacterium SM1_3_5]
MTTLADRSTIAPAWDEQQITLSAATTALLHSIAKQHQLTLNTLMQGAFGLLLSRFTGETDVVFGATSAGRTLRDQRSRSLLPEAESMVGLFINTLPVRMQIAPQSPLISWLQQLQTAQSEAMQYEFTPLWEIQDGLNRSGTPLFDSILVFENYPIAPALLQSDRDLQITAVQVTEWTSFPLTVLVSGADQLTIKAKFDRHRLPSDTIDRLLQHFEILLEAIAQNPQKTLSAFSLLTSIEQQQRQDWNQTEADYPPTTIHQLFEAQVDRTPDAIAVIFADQQITYRELNARANQLAHDLRSRHIQPEDRVGICVERSIELAIGLLGILKAGAAYVPIDPSYPRERSDFMAQDAGVKVLLVRGAIDSGCFNLNMPIVDLLTFEAAQPLIPIP